MLKTKHFARATESHLHLVKNEQRACFGAFFSQCQHPFLVGNHKSALALNHFSDYAGGLFGDLVEVVHIVEIQSFDILQQRFVSLIIFIRAPDAHRANRGAVVGIFERHNLLATGVAFGEFKRPVRRLRTAVDEKNIVQFRRQDFCKSLCEKHLRTLHNFTIDGEVHIFVNLIFDGFHHFGMPVSDIGDRHTRHHIDDAAAVGTVHIDALGAFHLCQKRRKRGLSHVAEEKLTVGC